MWLNTSPYMLSGVLLAFISLGPLHTEATSDVNVELKASFDPAPYLLELLLVNSFLQTEIHANKTRETAALENQTAYFPLLDRIADGYFAGAATDKELYENFVQLLQDEGHISDAETLAMFQYALSIHAAAPRIEAHYQFYNTSVEPLLALAGGGRACSTWAHFEGKRYCWPVLEESQGDAVGHISTSKRQLDRVLSLKPNLPSSILYADVTDVGFGDFHKLLSSSARQGKSSYRLRYTPSRANRRESLIVSGYGVELALKRTDYVVIDDRDADLTDNGGASAAEASAKQSKQDLRPLSKSELSQLGLKTADFVMSSKEPLRTLLDVSQDFPLHSSVIASHNVSLNLLKELQGDRSMTLPPGYNVFWMNGIPLDATRIDAHTLLQRLRLERKLISELKEFELSGFDAKNLLCAASSTGSQPNEGPQRFDFRDQIEGGGVIIWLNNIEKDKRYKGWPSAITALLQRTYPGQLPTVRRDIHNLVVPVDFSSTEDVGIVVEQLQVFVRRSIAMQFGLVPMLRSDAAIDQARVVYYLLDAYGISSVIAYLEACLAKKRCAKPDQSCFELAVSGRRLRQNREALALPEVLKLERIDHKLESARKYGRRLGIASTVPPVFVNGVALPRNDDWLSAVISRVSLDLRNIQEKILEQSLQEDTWLPGYLLLHATAKRNPLIIPEEESGARFLDVKRLHDEHSRVYDNLPRWKAEETLTKENWVHMLVIADFHSPEGKRFLNDALHFREQDPNLEVLIVHNPTDDGSSGNSALLDMLRFQSSKWPTLSNYFEGNVDDLDPAHYQQLTRDFVDALEFKPGQRGLISNGRVVGPIPDTSEFDGDDFAQLLIYERMKRSQPIHTALATLGLSDRIQDHQSLAQLISIIATSMTSTESGGVFATGPTSRVNVFEQWDVTYSAIQTGDSATASIYLVAAVDPASETAQRLLPIISVLSKLHGVHLKLFLNPHEVLQELPVKRFYRYVLNPKPFFNEDGSLGRDSARFTELPQDALLTVGLDVPPAWLVAPKESIHDLDNIKLNTLKDGQGVYALYELEYILIEGHSRDITNGSPPRGAQLLLGTERDSHATDTIVMANLGYFQFKANPGYWKIDLLSGRSQEIFTIESAGSKGYRSQAGDESTEIELLDFQGKTLFPRLSRNPGRETDDVLETNIEEPNFALNYASKGLRMARRIFSKLGMAKEKTAHAEINIFSVASGHLYERMLNIMMVSVMKHTKHTVKFWFIEQFLSPSFKDSIPFVAAEYGFTYEMVTYKWPHWLRQQREKQREIWGYKILFLDVLFPLSLDKVIFVDADQIVRTDMYDLVTHDLQGAPYGFTPMCDSRTEIEGFRFWKQGYWQNYLRGLPYHISALYVVDLNRFRQIAAGDRLRQQYHQLSADPNSLSNLDQDLPNHMQHSLPIHSLPQEWLWCETWCADADLASARTIDLCNNPMTKEPKLDRARRQVPEWTVYDEEIAEVIRRRGGGGRGGRGRSTVVEHTAIASSMPSHGEPSVYNKDEL